MKKSNFIQRTFLNAGAFVPSVNEQCTDRTNSENAIKGSLLFIPAVAAFFSYGYTAYFLSQSIPMSIGAGILAFFIIFLVDRSILALGKPSQLSIGILGRLTLSLVLSTLIAEPILIGVFQDSIREKQSTEIASVITRIDNRYDFKIKAANEEIAPLAEELKKLRDAYIAESDGSSGTMEEGLGPIYHTKKKAHDVYKVDTYDKTVVRVESQIADLNVQRAREIEQAKNSQATGMIGSLRSLHNLAEEEPIVETAMWLLRLALVLLEMLPVFIKLGTRKDNVYNQIADNVDENAIKAAELNNLDRLSVIVKNKQNIIAKELAAARLEGSKIEWDAHTDFATERLDLERKNAMRHIDEKGIALAIEDPKIREELLTRIDAIFDELNKSVQRSNPAPSI